MSCSTLYCKAGYDNSYNWRIMNKIATALRGKSRLIALIVFTLIIILATWLLKVFHNEIRAISDVTDMNPDVAVIRLKILINIIGYAMIVFGIGFGVYFLNLAFKVNSTGQFPPPNALLLRKTSTVYGSAAQFRETLLYVSAVASMLSGFLFTFILHSIINKI